MPRLGTVPVGDGERERERCSWLVSIGPEECGRGPVASSLLCYWWEEVSVRAWGRGRAASGVG